MKTLKQLVEENGLPLKVTNTSWEEYEWFEIRYEYCSYYYGHDNSGAACSYSKDDNEYKDYIWKKLEAPKPKVKMYLYAYREKSKISAFCMWQISKHYFRDDSHFLVEYFPYDNEKAIFQRLDWSEISAEVE